MSYVSLDEMFFRQLCKMSSRFANPTFLRRLKDILQRCFQSVFYHCLENDLTEMSKNCLCKMSYTLLYEMSLRQPCKISSRFANPRSFRPLKDILPRCLECLFGNQETFYCFKVFCFFKFIKHAVEHLILKYSSLFNTIPLSRTKTLFNNLLFIFKRATYNISCTISNNHFNTNEKRKRDAL